MTYEDYAKTSKHYDQTRRPIGLEVVLGCFATAGKPLSEAVILDAGCGTANYALEILPYVRYVVGVDPSIEMIAQAEEKARADGISADRISLLEGRLEQIPCEDGRFDCVMANQVLHHLEEGADGEFPLHRAALTEIARVTKPGGVLVINICSATQLVDGWWYSELFRHAIERLQRRHIPLSLLATLLGECGFVHHANMVPTDAVFQGKSYFDGSGPLREQWRDGDSVFALATEEELAEACARIRQMDKDGSLPEYVASQDRRRHDIGQVTFVYAKRVP